MVSGVSYIFRRHLFLFSLFIDHLSNLFLDRMENLVPKMKEKLDLVIQLITLNIIFSVIYLNIAYFHYILAYAFYKTNRNKHLVIYVFMHLVYYGDLLSECCLCNNYIKNIFL